VKRLYAGLTLRGARRRIVLRREEAATDHRGSAAESDFTARLRDDRLNPRRSQFDYLVLSDLRRAIGQLAARVDGVVVDYGCGSRPYESLFLGASYVGVDLHGNVLADLTVRDGRVPVPDQSADWVLSFQVLEHVPQPDAYLAECRRVMRKSGRVVLSTHGTWEYHPTPQDLYRWTHEGLTKLCADAGLRVVECRALTTGGRALIQLCLMVLRRRIPTAAVRAANWLGDRRPLERNRSSDPQITSLPIVYFLELARA
jgi:SAM-dependent methyltransferase